MYKKFILLIIIISFFTQASYSNSWDYWVRRQTPTLSWLYKLTFTDTLNGWAAGDSGVIIHTSNGGVTWVRQNSTVNNYSFFIWSISFSNPRRGWCIANDKYHAPPSTILRTTNGGLNWNAATYPDSATFLYTIYFRDSLNGWMSGSGGTFLQTTNAGQSWIRREQDTSLFSGFPVRNLDFYSRYFCFGTGGVNDFGGVIWRSTNSGMIWQANVVAPEPIFDLYFLDSLNILGCGGDFEFGASVVKTSNGGVNWNFEFIQQWGVASEIAFRNLAEIWLPLSISQAWALSIDSANSWHTIPAPDSSSVWDALFLDQFHGWGCGTNGLIVKYNPQPIGIQNWENILPASDILYQNYPNPFNPYTTIEYYLVKPAAVRISIYDVLGREIKTILSGLQKAGQHKLKLSGENLPSGIYFYKLESESFTGTKKMIILR